jgi:hypothetical protein
LLLPMILFLVLTLSSCQTIPEVPRFEFPPLTLSPPARPVLIEVPTDITGAVSALTLNLSKMNSYIEQLETYIRLQEIHNEMVHRIYTSE